MMNSGTRYAGMSTSGSRAIGAVVTSPTNPGTRPELSTPALTATTRSRIPRRFQAAKGRPAAKPGRRTRASATHGAVTPIAMSPQPAGHAKRPGSTPLALRARKPSPPALNGGLQPCGFVPAAQPIKRLGFGGLPSLSPSQTVGDNARSVGIMLPSPRGLPRFLACARNGQA